MPHEKFHYKSLEEVEQRAAELGVSLPFAVDTHCLAYPLQVRNITFPNRLGIAPMEGADSTPEGAPSAYTVRRYVNEAIGGSAVIWFEAISIVEEGRSSQTQLLLTRDTLDEFKKNDRRRQGGRHQGERLCAVPDHAGEPQRAVLQPRQQARPDDRLPPPDSGAVPRRR